MMLIAATRRVYQTSAAKHRQHAACDTHYSGAVCAGKQLRARHTALRPFMPQR